MGLRTLDTVDQAYWNCYAFDENCDSEVVNAPGWYDCYWMDVNCPVEADLEDRSDVGSGEELEPEGVVDSLSGEEVTESSFEGVIDDRESEIGDN